MHCGVDWFDFVFGCTKETPGFTNFYATSKGLFLNH